MHGGYCTGAPRGNRHALKHGRYSARTIVVKRQARQDRQRLKQLALLARYGFNSVEEFFAALEARLQAERQG